VGVNVADYSGALRSCPGLPGIQQVAPGIPWDWGKGFPMYEDDVNISSDMLFSFPQPSTRRLRRLRFILTHLCCSFTILIQYIRLFYSCSLRSNLDQCKLLPIIGRKQQASVIASSK
jgi:hypothetical protein